MEILSKNSKLEEYSTDKSSYNKVPSFVAFPKNESELIKIIDFAKKKQIKIIPRGGGTGLSGGCVGSGIIIDFSKHLNKINKVGKETIVESGSLLKNLRKRLKKTKYSITGVPLHGNCSIGGVISTCSVGPKSVSYGMVNSQVKSLRFILSDKRIIDTKKTIPKDLEIKIEKLKKKISKDKKFVKFLKSRAKSAGGINLKAFLGGKTTKTIITQLIVGSCGTLGLVTKIRLNLKIIKETKILYLIYCKDYEDLQKSLNIAKKLKPQTAELISKSEFNIFPKEYICEGENCGILVLGFTREIKDQKLSKYSMKIVKIRNKQRLREFWKIRKSALVNSYKKAREKNLEIPSYFDDFTINPKYFAKIMREIKKFFVKENIVFELYGHIGFGSLHIRPYLKKTITKKEKQKVIYGVFKIVKKFNGTLIGEHNMGPLKSHYIEKESKKLYKYMLEVKKIFDPKGLFSPQNL